MIREKKLGIEQRQRKSNTFTIGISKGGGNPNGIIEQLYKYIIYKISPEKKKI